MVQRGRAPPQAQAELQQMVLVQQKTRAVPAERVVAESQTMRAVVVARGGQTAAEETAAPRAIVDHLVPAVAAEMVAAPQELQASLLVLAAQVEITLRARAVARAVYVKEMGQTAYQVEEEEVQVRCVSARRGPAVTVRPEQNGISRTVLQAAAAADEAQAD